MRYLLLSAILFAAPAQAMMFGEQKCASPASAFVATLPCPKELQQILERQDSCEHFAGEEPYDAERRAFLNEQIEELGCGERLGKDKEALVRGYMKAKNIGALQVLREYEENLNGPLEEELGTPLVRDARHIIQSKN